MLHRLVGHLRKQDWTLITIELVIVVLGVFIGMQVQDWNADRQARARAQVFAARLRDDVEYERWHYEYMQQYYQEVLLNARHAVDALSGDAPLPDEQLLISAYRGTQYLFLVRQRATYDELVSTGTIGLIDDAKLRSTAVAVFNDELLNTIQANGIASDYRKEFRRTVPAAVQHALLQNCGDREVDTGNFQKMAGSIDYPCALGLPAQEIAEAARMLEANPAILPALKQRFADLETNVSDMRGNTTSRAGR
jgi:hypothetical protein